MARRSFLVLFFSLILLFVVTGTCLAADQYYSYYKNVKLVIGEKEAVINGQLQLMDQPACLKNDRTLVPFRFLGEALGADITWDAKTNQANLQLGSNKVIVTLGSKVAYVNNDLQTLDVPAQLINNRLFVPLRFISEALGAIVNFDAEDNSIDIRCVDTTQWEWYTAPKSGIKYLHPKDWTIKTEDDDTVVVFTSPNGSTLYAYWAVDPPEVCYTKLKSLAISEDWKYESEFYMDETSKKINDGFELQFSRYDASSGSYEWYLCYVDNFNNGNSIIGEGRVLNDYYSMDSYIMSILLFS